ncbi:hypothetical protein JTE90_022295 [Oedothorax gibbosus]|uniref:Uncharacterized protein n=1 Tax=Oedothorax gibbosus TaxID=931172 RepID=A0AAV6VVZ5_9ARAC|nr:hypothetical protein JTE90_022295 [Oedothorax gibbosus]
MKRRGDSWSLRRNPEVVGGRNFELKKLSTTCPSNHHNPTPDKQTLAAFNQLEHDENPFATGINSAKEDNAAVLGCCTNSCRIN